MYLAFCNLRLFYNIYFAFFLEGRPPVKMSDAGERYEELLHSIDRTILVNEFRLYSLTKCNL